MSKKEEYEKKCSQCGTPHDMSKLKDWNPYKPNQRYTIECQNENCITFDKLTKGGKTAGLMWVEDLPQENE